MVVSAKMDGRDEASASAGCQFKTASQRYKLKQRYEVIKNLGQGTYGRVQLALDKMTDEQVAIKTIKKKKIENDQDLNRIRREINIMSSLNHPHIINIREVFENTENLIIVMEYASGGELYDYLIAKRRLDDDDSRRLFRQIASAIHYCHKYNIVHRDLKLENILLDHNCKAKIADFGLSNFYSHHSLLHTFCGSPLYASPEIVKGTPYHGPEVDCWSLGVLLYTLIYGAMPFDGANFQRLVQQISEGDYYEPRLPSDATGLIRHMLMVSPGRRATIADICSHWWVNFGYKISLLEEADDYARQTPNFHQPLLADFQYEESKIHETIGHVSFNELLKNIDEINNFEVKNSNKTSQPSSLPVVNGYAQINTTVPVEASQELTVKFQDSVRISLSESLNIDNSIIMPSCDTTPIKSILRRRRYTGCDSGCILDSSESMSQDGDLEIAIENTFGQSYAIRSPSDTPSPCRRLVRRPSKGKYVRKSSTTENENTIKTGESISTVQKSNSWSSTGSSEIIDDGYSEPSDNFSQKSILKVRKADEILKIVKAVETHHVPLKGILKNRRHSLNESRLMSGNCDTLYGHPQPKPKGILKDTNSHGDFKEGELGNESNERKMPKGILKNKNQSPILQASVSMNFVDAIDRQDDLMLDSCSSKINFLSPPTKPKSILKNRDESRLNRTNRSNSLPIDLSLEQRTCQFRIESIVIDSTECVHIERKGILKKKQSNLPESPINNEHLPINGVSPSSLVPNLSSVPDETDDSTDVLKKAMDICNKCNK